VDGVERRCIALVELLSIDWVRQEFCFIESGDFYEFREDGGAG
jgi:hypothetical protein